jgi:hypothetical protein
MGPYTVAASRHEVTEYPDDELGVELRWDETAADLLRHL